MDVSAVNEIEKDRGRVQVSDAPKSEIDILKDSVIKLYYRGEFDFEFEDMTNINSIISYFSPIVRVEKLA